MHCPMVQLRAMVQNCPCGRGRAQYRSNLLNALNSHLNLKDKLALKSGRAISLFVLS